jgi:hypothetical protein
MRELSSECTYCEVLCMYARCAHICVDLSLLMTDLSNFGINQQRTNRLFLNAKIKPV